MNKEVKYCKVFDLDSVALKVSGNYNYLHNAPYFGFQVMTTSGECAWRRGTLIFFFLHPGEKSQ